MATKNRTTSYFLVDMNMWPKVVSLGVNAATVYLVLASGTDKANTLTRWSVNSVELRTGIGRRRARATIDLLREKRILKKAGPPPYLQNELVLSKEPDWVFLPSTLIDGATIETPPLDRVRRLQNVALIDLLVRLYHLHDLPTDGGVDWRNLRQVYDRSLITSRGRWNIFTFVHKTSTAPWSSPLRKAISGQTNESNDAFWEAIQALQGCGLIEFVQHLVEADTDDAEIIVPMPQDCGTDDERAVHAAMRSAALAVIGEGNGFYYEADSAEYLAVIPDSFPEVAMIGVPRLRYRPHSPKTSQWMAGMEHVREYVESLALLESAANEGLPLVHFPADLRQSATSKGQRLKA